LKNLRIGGPSQPTRLYSPLIVRTVFVVARC
jgi:hypothetical protein